MAQPPVIDPADRLSKLPDEILAHILSCLPAQEAVQTCILGRTWRNLWKMTSRLFINGHPVHEVRKFVDGLLRARLDGLQLAPFHSCDIVLEPIEDYEEHIVKSRSYGSVDRGFYLDLDLYLRMSKAPLVSLHLTRLELLGVMFMCRRLNFSRCPALEHLEISGCCLLYVEKMASPSVKRLVITCCETTQSQSDIDSDNAQDTPKCYLLQGLAEAKDLEMIAHSDSKDIFVRDLRWCPIFSKLKTLLLNYELCDPSDCTLVCILGHAPVLEKLTLSDKYKVEVRGCLDEKVKSTMTSQHLKIVEVKCDIVNERFLNIVNFFGTLNICKL
ncbi:unnamed protein product [Urochloa decumbens]|uniref:F-box domain-containing protein n=1 Tax=Urochloa decumbens TaxID=240449 RepID=A0ABC9B614_9POAL